RIGKTYDETRQADPYIVQRLLHHLGIVDGTRCLDVGCGTGNYTIALAQSGLKMVGLDSSQTMIRKAATKSSDIVWQIGSSNALPFASESFDAVVSTLVHHHFDDVRC